MYFSDFQSYDNFLCFIFCECWWIMSTRTINIFIFSMYILISVAHQFHKHVLFVLQGYGSFLLRDLPFDAIQFCIYEQLRIGYRLTVFISLIFDEYNVLFMKNSMFVWTSMFWLLVQNGMIVLAVIRALNGSWISMMREHNNSERVIHSSCFITVVSHQEGWHGFDLLWNIIQTKKILEQR